MESFSFSKELSIVGEYDVVVCGAGPAGFAAAVESVRSGAKTALLERYGSLGGNLTIGHVGPIMGSTAGGTLGDEMIKRLGIPREYNAIDFENAKRILIDWAFEEGLEVFLQTPTVSAVMTETAEGSRRPAAAVVALKTGLAAIRGNVFIDATGDGDFAHAVGAKIMYGRDGDGLVQPVSIMFTVTDVEESALFCGGEQSPVMLGDVRYVDFCHIKHDEGELPKNVSIVRLYAGAHAGDVIVNATQLNEVNPLDHHALAEAERTLRSQFGPIIAFLRKYVPGYAMCRIKDSAGTVGIRESRRVQGLYVLQDEDLLSGKRFDDVVVHKANFVIDIHNPAGGGQAEGLAKKVVPYDIPYRCLVPDGIDGLLTAGRCISGTHRAHASYRVMKICMAIGQAAGAAAALSATTGKFPRDVDVGQIQKILTDHGADLFSA